MTTLKSASENYESSMVNNIVDLDKIDVNNEIFKDVMEWEDGPKEYEYIKVGDDRYRIPVSVKKQLKIHLQENKDLKYFKVIKDGSGLNTTYTVVPLSSTEKQKSLPKLKKLSDIDA